MKKSLFLLGCFTLLMAGCNKVGTMEEPAEVPSGHLTFDIKVDYDAGTRAVKKGWDVGDKIYVVFDNFFSDDEGRKTYYLTLSFKNGTSWTGDVSDPDLEEYLLGRTSGKLAAVYISGGREPQFEFIPGGTAVNPVTQLKMVNNEGLTGFFLSSGGSEGTPYTVADNRLSATLEMVLEPNYVVHFFLPGIPESDVANYTLKCSKLQPGYFKLFGYFHFDLGNGSTPLEFGPYTDVATGGFGERILGSYIQSYFPSEEGAEFVGYLSPADCLDTDATPWVGKATDYTLRIVNDFGTPSDTSDDLTFTLTRTATVLNPKDAVKLPALDSGAWTITNGAPLDLDFNIGFGGFSPEQDETW